MCFIFLLSLPEISAGVTPELPLMPWPIDCIVQLVSWLLWMLEFFRNSLENYITKQGKVSMKEKGF